ncbi:integrase [Peribacillus frigoritolerans]|uniref:integrase n=1 Tax=Peribacillus frigoritolerans TaxID=450367 RepID=UPI003F855CB9
MSHIERWANEYLKSDKTYENHINKFVTYIFEIDKGDKPTKINTDDVENCIGYYKELGQINTINSMENHIEGIKSFYKFLVSKAWATDIFSGIYDYQGYKSNLAQKFNLAESKERENFDAQTIKSILDNLDNYFTLNNINNLSGQKKKRYNNYLILRIFIKLTLISPSKRAKICNIKKSDFGLDFRTFKINDVTINVPNGLRRDLITSISYIEELKNKKINDNDNLFSFLDVDVFRPENLNMWFCNFIKEYKIINIPDSKTTYSVEVIMNSGIAELIRKGVDSALISMLSGISISSLEKKYYKVREYEPEEINKLINEGLAKSS